MCLSKHTRSALRRVIFDSCESPRNDFDLGKTMNEKMVDVQGGHGNPSSLVVPVIEAADEPASQAVQRRDCLLCP